MFRRVRFARLRPCTRLGGASLQPCLASTAPPLSPMYKWPHPALPTCLLPIPPSLCAYFPAAPHPLAICGVEAALHDFD